MLSSCPVELPNRLGWLKSGRFLRLLFAVVGIALLAALLYNAMTVDRVAPTFSLHLSSSNSSGLGLTLTSVDVDFSEGVRQATAEGAFSVTPAVDGTFHWQGQKMIFTPSSKLPLSTTFHVHMNSGVQDLAGNVQRSGSDLTFTTVGAPIVSAVVPITGANDVAVNSTIQITFDRFMDTQKVLSGLTIEPSVRYRTSWNGLTLTITPNKPLQFSTEYTVKLGDPAVDTDGTKVKAFVSTFDTVSVGLQVTALVPTPNVAGVSVRSQIEVVFDGSIDPSSVAGAITLTPPVSGSTKTLTLPDDRVPAQSASATSAASDQQTLVFTPDQPLAAHTTYSVAMSASVHRVGGQVLAGQAWSFTTGESPVSALNQVAFLSDRSGVANVWLMNPDGSNQRQVTSELVPVSGFDFSGDGTTIAYAAGGVVEKMSVGGSNLTTLTASGNIEYAPLFTPDGTRLVVARRDATGADLGYWRIPLTSGDEAKQIVPDGAPGLGSAAMMGEQLTGQQGASQWATRAAVSADGATMLVVRGLDNAVEVVDLSGAHQPTKVNLVGNSRPIWVASSDAFLVTATDSQGVIWSSWRITEAGEISRVLPSVGDLSGSGAGLAFVVETSDGSAHLTYSASSTSADSIVLTTDSTWNEYSPSISPDGAKIVFGRVLSQIPTMSAGIWVVNKDGSGLTNLSTDGAYPRWLP